MTQSILHRAVGLAELLDAPTFQEVCRSFVDLYRVGIKVFDAEGHRLVDEKAGSGEFCSWVFARPSGRALCIGTVNHVKGFPLPVVPGAGGIEATSCFSGARYLMMPVTFEGDVLGRVVLGPFLPAELDDVSPELREVASPEELEHARGLLLGLRRASESTLRKVAVHFSHVLEVLLFSSYRTRLTTQMHIETVTESYRELQEKSRALRESYDRLRDLDRLKSNFLATVSHELRTPLTSVIGYSEMLLSGLAGEVTPEQHDYLSTILEKGETLLNLISSLLDLSKLEASGAQLSLEPSDVPRIVRTAVSTVLPSATEKNVTIDQQVQDGLPLVSLDPNKVRQCVVNLLANAVKFTPEGGRVTIRAGFAELPPPESGPFGRAGRLEIAVADTGKGIPKSEHGRIFDSFYQVDGSSTREHGGAGLGLAIVRSYVEAHHGTVYVDSHPGEGSTFTLSFPLENSTGVPMEETPRQSRRERSEASSDAFRARAGQK